MTPPIQCPACMHEETVRARTHGREPSYDDLALMRWTPPYGGARGQQVSRWDGGAWGCQLCDLRLSPRDAFLLLQAALEARDPDCDSRGEDGIYEDARRATKGGDR